MIGAYQMALKMMMSLKMKSNQHKLFMAFKLPSVKVVNMHPAPYKQESSFTFRRKIYLISKMAS